MLARLLTRAKMNLTPMYAFATEVEAAPKQAKVERPTSIQTYKDGQLVTRNFLTLKKTQDIEGYVIQTLKNYYRTTNKIEDDLGYVISAETLPVLNKVKHYVNYINHVEQFKTETQRDPLP